MKKFGFFGCQDKIEQVLCDDGKMQIKIRAIGRLKVSAFAQMVQEYAKRMRTPVTVEDFEAKKKTSSDKMQEEEGAWLIKNLSKDAFVVALDERGKGLTSPQFAKLLEEVALKGVGELIFLIGGADGLIQEVRGRADMLLSFGSMVWPHKLVRVMLMEQLYRAQQIQAGHPYHRD